MFPQVATSLATTAVFFWSVSATDVNYSNLPDQVTAALPACFDDAVAKMAAKLGGKSQAKTKLCTDTCTRPYVANPRDAPMLVSHNALYDCIQEKVYAEQGLSMDDIAKRQGSIRTYVQNFATPLARDVKSDKFWQLDPKADATLKYILTRLGGTVNRIRIAADTASVQLEEYYDIDYLSMEEQMGKQVDFCLEKKLETAAGGKSYTGLSEEEKKKANEIVGKTICMDWYSADSSADGYKIVACLERKTAPKMVEDALKQSHPEMSDDDRKALAMKFQTNCPRQMVIIQMFTSFYATKLVCAKLGLDKSLTPIVQNKLKARVPGIQKTLDELASGTGKQAKKVVAYSE